MINQTLTKTRPDDVLGNLSENDQDRILDWLEHISYREVLKRIAEPAPEGFGLNIHYNTLRKFYLKNLPLVLYGIGVMKLWSGNRSWTKLHASPLIFRISFANPLKDQS